MIEAIVFYLLAALALVGAIGVIVSRSIIRAAVSLLFTLISVGGLFALLDAEFLAAAQLIIFVGGVLVLIVFGVMLTARQWPGGYASSSAEVLVALVLAGLLAATICTAISRAHFSNSVAQASGYQTESFGSALLGQYVLPFELLSVLMLIVLIGAAYLSRGRSSATTEPR